MTVHIQNCSTCKQSKASNQTMRPLMGSFVKITRTWQKIYVDFLGPYPRSKRGNTTIIIILDHLSKFVILKAVKHANADILVNCLKHDVFSTFGVPELLHSDNGRQFESHVFGEFLRKYGVTHVFTPKYSPQSNASERVNRTILAAIRSYVRENHQDWDLYLDDIAGALRNITHDSTGYSPYFLVFGKHMVKHGSIHTLLNEINTIDPNHIIANVPDERLKDITQKVLANLKKAYEKHKFQYNRTARFKKFSINDPVFVRNFAKSKASDHYSDKLAPKFLPGIIKRRIGRVAYEVMDSNGKILGIFHGKDLKQ